MDTRVVASNMVKLIKQRNACLMLFLVMLSFNGLLTLKLVTSDEKTILVPSLQKALVVSGNKVDESYVEEMSLFYLNYLLNVTTSDLKYKRDLILKYTTSSSLAKFIEYFQNIEAEYSKFDLATSFTVKNFEIDTKNLEVIATGLLSARYGKSGYETREVKYRLKLEYVGRVLKLKEFAKLTIEEAK